MLWNTTIWLLLLLFKNNLVRFLLTFYFKCIQILQMYYQSAGVFLKLNKYVFFSQKLINLRQRRLSQLRSDFQSVIELFAL